MVKEKKKVEEIEEEKKGIKKDMNDLERKYQKERDAQIQHYFKLAGQHSRKRDRAEAKYQRDKQKLEADHVTVMNKLSAKFEAMKNKHTQELIDIETSMSIQATEWESKVATAEDLASRAQGMVSEEKRKSRNLIQKQFEKAAIERLRLKQILKTAKDFNVKLRYEKR